MSILALGERLINDMNTNKVEKQDIRLKEFGFGWSYLIFFVVVLIKSVRACS